MNPWSAKPKFYRLPGRLSKRRRAQRLREIEERCAINELGCWLYPAVRDERFPYIDATGDEGQREQWSARRYVWALKHGEIPDRGILLGACPYTACVLPDHQALWVPPLQLDWLGA